MKTSSEFAAEIQALTGQVAKISNESQQTLAKVKELEDALANSDDIPESVLTAFADLKAQVQKVDDAIPDVSDSTTTIPADEETTTIPEGTTTEFERAADHTGNTRMAADVLRG